MSGLDTRDLHLLGALGAPTTKMIGNKEYLVVPVVALMEGVIHAVNAETPEFVPFETLEKAASTWNGCPVTLGHPKRNGTQCSANDPGILDSHGIGIIANARVDVSSKKMLMDAMIEKSRAKKLHPDMYERLAQGETEEVSVGALVASDHKPGKYGPKSYVGSWLMAKGDHLAFLPGGRGACSVAMGCGTHRAAMRVCADRLEDLSEAELVALGALPDKSQVEVEGTMKVGDKVMVKKTGHAADGKTGVITASKDGKHTVGDHGTFMPSELRAAQDGNTSEADAAEEQAEMIAYQTMRNIWDALDPQWDQVSKTIDDLIAAEKDPTETPEEEDAEEQVETASIESIRTILQSMVGAISGLISLTYGAALSDQPRYGAERDLAGARHNVADTKAIQAVHDHSMALGATCDRGNYKQLSHSGSDRERNIKEVSSKLDAIKLNDPTRRYIEKVKAGAQ